MATPFFVPEFLKQLLLAAIDEVFYARGEPGIVVNALHDGQQWNQACFHPGAKPVPPPEASQDISLN